MCMYFAVCKVDQFPIQHTHEMAYCVIDRIVSGNVNV